MLYRDLLQFEPLETVIQLKETSNKDKALQLVDTYVISERMAEVINDVILEQLQFDKPADNKGILIVGNYGTGKSHLMSVIAAIAEMENTAQRLTNQQVADKAKDLEGRFKVIRTELDGITMSLQEFFFGEVTDYLQSVGVDYQHPELDKLRSNKDELVRLMAAFEEVYPEQGLLFIVDELLEYLRSRKERELILDLNFLRVLGEICGTTRLRFIAGIQEMLFDNPKFAFVANELSRVKERMEQAVIVREDIEYVVSHRLLRKTEYQKGLIRDHLQRFVLYYEKLNEQLEKYVELFPIHPAYLSVFEKVIVAEKRQILKTISLEMKKLLDHKVPEDQPGVISYDSYWPYIEGDKTLKAEPNVREVMSKATILLDRIEHAFTRPSYKPMAKRIVQALAVFRLTTGDIYAKVGVTAAELRDQLFLFAQLPEEDGEFLLGQVEVVLKEILKTVSYQYISVNNENGQYYLDLHKDIDVDNLIEQRAETLSNDELDRYYYEVLAWQTGHTTDSTYRPGYRIWQHELPWYQRKVTRPGYLFFGYPNERSTTQPERDFYIYLLPVFDKKPFKNENKPDEVFFTLETKDEAIYRKLRLYAGAKTMASTNPGGTRKLYEDKASAYLKDITVWFKENMTTAYKMTYQGKIKRLAEWQIVFPPQASVREIIDAASQECLSGWFNDKYPDYPVFSKVGEPITSTSMLTTYIPEALRNIKEPKTKNGIAILDGLVLLDQKQRLNIHRSGYARWVLELLAAKPEGQVVNAFELIDVVETYNKYGEVKRTVKFDLEPELFAVVLAALVYNGDIVLTINGITYDGMNFDELIKLSPVQIADFSHLKRPSQLPLAALGALCDLFGIGRGLLNQDNLQQFIQELHQKTRLSLERTVQVEQEIKDGIPFLEVNLLSDAQLRTHLDELKQLKEFLQRLEAYDTPAKLKNLPFGVEDIEKQEKTIKLTYRLSQLRERALSFLQEANYLVTAQNILPTNHHWSAKAAKLLSELALALKNNEDCQAQKYRLKQLKEEYYDLYLNFHRQARLSATQEHKKEALLADGRVTALKQLSGVNLLSTEPFAQWLSRLKGLKACWSLTKADLEHTPYCKNCQYRPSEAGSMEYVALEELEEELEQLLDNWTATLLANLTIPEIQESITLLQEKQKEAVADFIRKQELTLPVAPHLVEGINILMQGIETVTITLSDLKNMMNNGQPLTVEELQERFANLLKGKVGSYPRENVRIMLGD